MADTLLKGFKKFKKKEYDSPKGSMMELIENGQRPDTFIISCIDSRANPGTIFESTPGTFFGHKAMGAIVRPYKKGTALAAALQFALIHNGVKKVIIMGHTGCGAIKAIIDNIEDPEISTFLAVTKGALDNAHEAYENHQCEHSLQRECEEQVVLESYKNIKGYPSVKQALEEERVEIKLWLFDMENAKILEHNADTQEFKEIDS
jgi:carbonic anhydrase